MKTVKLKTSNKSFFGRSLIIPVVGEVSFSESGEIEVEDSIVEQLKAYPELGFGKPSEKIAPKKQEDDIQKVEEVEQLGGEQLEDLPDVQDENLEETEELSSEDVIAELNTKTLLELKGMVAEFKDETKGFTKKSQYIDFIIQNM
jgi:hypothetical protein